MCRCVCFISSLNQSRGVNNGHKKAEGSRCPGDIVSHRYMKL